jgi:hypothetical protein
VEERRQGAHQKALKSGRIVINNRRSVVNCLIRNLSDGGAQLRVESATDIPAEFTLMFDDGRPARDCVVKWRKLRDLGVAFKPGS